MKLLRFTEYIKESLPQAKSVEQLKMVRKISKSTDIGDRISDMNKQGANIQYISNPIDTGVETYQDYMKNQKVTSTSDYDDSDHGQKTFKNLQGFPEYSVPQQGVEKTQKVGKPKKTDFSYKVK